MRGRTTVMMALTLVLLSGVGAYFYNYVRSALKGTAFALPATIAYAYKWQGPGGSWHITQDLPPKGACYEKLSAATI